MVTCERCKRTDAQIRQDDSGHMGMDRLKDGTYWCFVCLETPLVIKPAKSLQAMTHEPWYLAWRANHRIFNPNDFKETQ